MNGNPSENSPFAEHVKGVSVNPLWRRIVTVTQLSLARALMELSFRLFRNFSGANRNLLIGKACSELDGFSWCKSCGILTIGRIDLLSITLLLVVSGRNDSGKRLVFKRFPSMRPGSSPLLRICDFSVWVRNIASEPGKPSNSEKRDMACRE